MSHAPEKYEETAAGALAKVPYDVAHALLLLSFREAWRAALACAERGGRGGCPAREGLPGALLAHQRAEEAREAWEVLGERWAKGPHGEREGAEVVRAVTDMATSAALHCTAARVWPASAPGGKRGLKEQRGEVEEHYRSFEAATSALKEHGGVLAPNLRHSISALLWNLGWHAANAVGGMLDEAPDEEEEEESGEEGEGDGDDAAGEEDEEDEDDLDKRFGDDYPGSSDDHVDDLRSALNAFRECFWDAKPWRGVSLSLASLDEAGACAELEAIGAVPGLFGEPGLNAVRLVVGGRSGERDALGAVARSALLRARQLSLQVVLELPAVPGKEHEAWLREAAASAAEAGCVRGVALPRLAAGAAGAAELVAAVRAGGLAAERCAVLVPAPGGRAADAEDEWTPEFRALHECGAGGLADGALPWLLRDGNVLLEAAPCYSPAEDGGPEDLRGLLDATADQLQFSYLSVAAGLTLELPRQVQVEPTMHWYREYAQRLVGASTQQTTHGFFFDSWAMPERTGPGVTGLKEYLAQGVVDLSADCGIMYPVGAHKASIVYLHGFTCNHYDYLLDPRIFYRPRPPKKGKDRGTRTCAKEGRGDAGEEEDIEYEPWPGLKVIFPTAPIRKITAYGGEENSSWFDYATDFEGEAEDEVFESGLEEQARRVHALLDAEAGLVGADNVYLGGASQGGCAALHVALTYPGDLGAVVCTMGHLMKYTPVSPEWVARRIPVYNYLGASDTTFPWDKWVRGTWDRFERAGGEVHHHLEPGLDHCEGEDKWVPAFLKECLTPSPAQRAATAARKAAKTVWGAGPSPAPWSAAAAAGARQDAAWLAEVAAAAAARARGRPSGGEPGALRRLESALRGLEGGVERAEARARAAEARCRGAGEELGALRPRLDRLLGRQQEDSALLQQLTESTQRAEERCRKTDEELGGLQRRLDQSSRRRQDDDAAARTLQHELAEARRGSEALGRGSEALRRDLGQERRGSRGSWEALDAAVHESLQVSRSALEASHGVGRDLAALREESGATAADAGRASENHIPLLRAQ